MGRDKPEIFPIIGKRFFPSGKKGMRKISFFRTPFPKGKKGMEMWQLVLLILAIFLLLFVIMWYGGLGDTIRDMLGKLGDLL